MARNSLLFGTGGVPHSAAIRSAVSGIQRIRELGLGCMELEFVHQVKMGSATAREVAAAAHQAGVSLSVHAPYYINFNSREPEKVTASRIRLLQAARVGSLCGAHSVIFHAAFYLGDPPEQVYSRVKNNLIEILEVLQKENIRIWLRPEVMGKASEFGTIDEILRLSTELEGVRPALDVAHWHARAGQFNTYPEFMAVLDQIKTALGPPGLADMHIHLSGIRYGKSGEIKHLNLEESDFQFLGLLQALRDTGAGGSVVCESRNLEQDALLLQQAYRDLSKEA